MNIIGFAGNKYVGKTTAAIVFEELYQYKRIAFADPLKQGLVQITGRSVEYLNEHKEDLFPEYPTLTPRSLMQVIGTDVIRKAYKDFWVIRMEKMLKEHSGNVVIDDIRFQNEVELVHSYGGNVYRILRSINNVDSIVHPSEDTGWLIHVTDIANNSTLEDFISNITELANLIHNKEEKR